MHTPAVTVVMPARDEARYIRQAIDSILTQTFPDFELVVVDDGSRDRTPAILDDYAGRDRRITVLRNAQPLGVAAALNRGIQAGRAPLVARMDADDWSLPGRLAQQVRFLAARPHVVMCGAATELRSPDGQRQSVYHPPTGYAAIRAALPSGNPFVHGSVMFRRREVENAGLYSSDPRYLHAEDYELWVRLAARHDVDNMPEVLYAYRMREPRPAMTARQEASTVVIRELAAGVLGAPPGGDVPEPYTAAPRGRILVLIASYRDPDLQWTLHDLFTRARHPEEITVGLCAQYEPRFDADCFRIRTRPDQVRTIHVQQSDARGLGWARHLTERLWSGEEYVLQIDGHMRFADGWDETLLDQLGACRSRYPMLTVYPWSFEPPRTLHTGPPLRMTAFKFYDTNLPVFVALPEERPAARPMPHAFWAGGFAFSRAEVLREVPQDPHLYFNDTEPTHSIRLWTHGWDLFAPATNVIWHCYGPSKRGVRSPWTDDRGWHARHLRSQARARHLVGLAPASADDVRDLPRYGLGTHRTLRDYQAFAGVHFATRTLEERATKGICAPEFARPRH